MCRSESHNTSSDIQIPVTVQLINVSYSHNKTEGTFIDKESQRLRKHMDDIYIITDANIYTHVYSQLKNSFHILLKVHNFHKHHQKKYRKQ